MSKVGNLFVGNQLFCGVAEHLGAPLPPVGLGVGPTKIRGAGFIAGPLLVGSPFTFTKGPNVNEANLMVARCGNPEALPPPPSIFKVSSLGFPPTPIDIMLGAPEGPVGITCFCGPQPFLVQSVKLPLRPVVVGEGRVAVWVWHVRVLSLRVAGVNDLVDNGAVASRDIGLRAQLHSSHDLRPAMQ